MKYLLLVLQSLVPLPVLSFPGGQALAQWRGPGGWETGPGMMGWGILTWFGPIMMLIFWIALILAIIFFIRWLIFSAKGSRQLKPEDSALDILKKRYARGEIDKEEFEEKKKDLS